MEQRLTEAPVAKINVQNVFSVIGDALELPGTCVIPYVHAESRRRHGCHGLVSCDSLQSTAGDCISASSSLPTLENVTNAEIKLPKGPTPPKNTECEDCFPSCETQPRPLSNLLSAPFTPGRPACIVSLRSCRFWQHQPEPLFVQITLEKKSPQGASRSCSSPRVFKTVFFYDKRGHT